MKAPWILELAGVCLLVALLQTPSSAETIVDSDFSQGDFASLGWQAIGDWDVFLYPREAANNPGRVARFPTNRPDGSLTKTFAEIRNPSNCS